MSGASHGSLAAHRAANCAAIVTDARRYNRDACPSADAARWHLGGARLPLSSAGSGRRTRSSSAPRCPVSRAVSTSRQLADARNARRRRIAARRPRRPALVALARPVPARRLRCAARARLDAARAGRQSAFRGRRRAAAPIRLPAVRAARRRHGEPGRARRRCRAALRLVRRFPAAGTRAGGAGATAARRISRCGPDCRSRSCAASRPTHDDVLGPGDMLYLPPSFAHDGMAVDPCMTYSIGFRAPATNELATAFLDWLRDRLALDGRYADPGPSRHRASPHGSTRRCSAAARRCSRAIRWDRADADRFLGTLPLRAEAVGLLHAAGSDRCRAGRSARARAARACGSIARTQLLYDDALSIRQRRRAALAGAGGATLRRLANDARTAGDARSRARAADALRLMYDWYRHGYLHPDAA